MSTGATIAVPDSPVAIKAYRVWALRPTAAGPRLRSIWFPDDRTWPAYQRFTAECNVCRFRPVRHRAPKPAHTCGIYAMKSVEDLWLWAIDNTPPGGRPVVCGEVWCWGTVVEGELGYRAQYAYPASFLGAWFTDPSHATAVLGQLSAAYGVPVQRRDDFPSVEPGVGERGRGLTGPVVLAVDIGGTKMAAGIVGPDGRLRQRSAAPTPQVPDGEAVFAALAAVIAELSTDGATACGVGSGGPMAGGDSLSPLHIPGWRAFPLRSRLAALTGLPTFVDNDAKALALGEGWVGAAAGVDNFIGMVVSTGVGGGIVLDGALLDGAAGNAGHIGHVVVEPDGRPCYCGGRGCLEAEASGTAIAEITGRPAVEAGPEVVARTGRLVGRAVASVANLLDLRLAVVAGSVALGFGDPFFAAAQAELDARARIVFARGARIVPAALGDSAPLIGAAAVARHGLAAPADP